MEPGAGRWGMRKGRRAALCLEYSGLLKTGTMQLLAPSLTAYGRLLTWEGLSWHSESSSPHRSIAGGQKPTSLASICMPSTPIWTLGFVLPQQRGLPEQEAGDWVQAGTALPCPGFCSISVGPAWTEPKPVCGDMAAAPLGHLLLLQGIWGWTLPHQMPHLL